MKLFEGDARWFQFNVVKWRRNFIFISKIILLTFKNRKFPIFSSLESFKIPYSTVHLKIQQNKQNRKYATNIIRLLIPTIKSQQNSKIFLIFKHQNHTHIQKKTFINIYFDFTC